MSVPLIGLVAVGTIFVEGGPGTTEAFTEAERSAAQLAVFLAEQQLARMSVRFSPNTFLQCSFFNEFRSAVINPGFISPPTNTTTNPLLRQSEIDTREPQWRELAMEAIGFPAAAGAQRERYQDELLLKDWRVPQKPRHAIIIFVTKFPTGWMAYADPAERSTTVQFDWIGSAGVKFLSTGTFGYGLANLDRVLAHEIGHLFGGLDEYGPCRSFDTSGPRPTTNANCGGFEDCLMKHNSPVLCPATAEHLGWVDLDGDGAVDGGIAVVTHMSSHSGRGGDTVSIFGEGLGESRSVVFVGVGAAAFTIVADTRLDVVVPDGSGTDIDLFVTTPFGVTAPAVALRFSYI
ncbi:hypothetical protein [Nocardia sp. NPDC050793]|uniref:hypothetical protein n=1 Tax=Nocardia sp. NPDC050793 TaxID=3155159 RepID=UPI0033FAF97C